jgi:hypothetical protein
VRDVSRGGLSLQTELEAAQGDTLWITIEPGRRGLRRVEVQAIVWHLRRVRDRSSGARSLILGLVLSEATSDFITLLEQLSPRKRLAQDTTRAPTLRKVACRPPAPPVEPRAEPEPQPESPAQPKSRAVAKPVTQPKPEPSRAPSALVRFRVRVKQEGGPRTRSIVVFAESAVDAHELALEETEPGWFVLDVKAD